MIGALANVEINLASLKDADAVAQMREEAEALRERAGSHLAEAGAAFRRRTEA